MIIVSNSFDIRWFIMMYYDISPLNYQPENLEIRISWKIMTCHNLHHSIPFQPISLNILWDSLRQFFQNAIIWGLSCISGLVDVNKEVSLCATVTSGNVSKHTWTIYDSYGGFVRETSTSCVNHTFPAAGWYSVSVEATPDPELSAGYVETVTAYAVVQVCAGTCVLRCYIWRDS